MEILSEAKLFWIYLQNLQIAQYSDSQMVVCVLLNVATSKYHTRNPKDKSERQAPLWPAQ